MRGNKRRAFTATNARKKMKDRIYITEFKAINVLTGDLESYQGLEVTAKNELEAYSFLDELGITYLKIVGYKTEETVLMELAVEAAFHCGNREN